jgi:glucokinase
VPATIEDGTVITANLPWPLSLADVRARTGLDELRLVNDFEAVAYAAAQVDASEVLQLAGPEAPATPAGPILIVGPGTGLGAAVWIPTRSGPVVLPTEAGQSALAAGNDVELDILRHWLRNRAHVPNEHALSGPGLLHLYLALCEMRGAAPHQTTPGDITAAALADEDALAREALDVFCGLLGSTVGDMALPTASRAACTWPAASCRKSAISSSTAVSSNASSTRAACAKRWNAFP